MKTLLAFAFILLGSSFTQAETLKCQSSVNLVKQIETAVHVNPGQSAPLFDVASFRFKINHPAVSKYEIEVFDGNAQTRSYATGNLDAIGSEIKWTLWSREILIEASCVLMGR